MMVNSFIYELLYSRVNRLLVSSILNVYTEVYNIHTIYAIKSTSLCHILYGVKYQTENVQIYFFEIAVGFNHLYTAKCYITRLSLSE